MCMCAVHGGADRSSRRDLPRKGSDMYAWSCSRTVRARADAPASMCHHARCAHARRWQRMGNKRIPTAPNQLLTGILASIMHSLCLFRRNPADNAACAPRCTAAQPCRPAPSMPLTAKIWIFLKSKTVRSRTHVRSLTFLEKARPISPLAEIRQNNSRKNCGNDLNSTPSFAPFDCLCVSRHNRDY